MSAEESKSLLEKILGKLEIIASPPSVQTVKIQRKFITSKCLLDRTSKTQTTKQDIPDMQIANPYDAPAKLISLTLIPDATFKTNGIVEININDVNFFPRNTAGDLTDFSTFSIPISSNGYDVRQNNAIDIFIWSASGTIALSVVAVFEVEYR